MWPSALIPIPPALLLREVSLPLDQFYEALIIGAVSGLILGVVAFGLGYYIASRMK